MQRTHYCELTQKSVAMGLACAEAEPREAESAPSQTSSAVASGQKLTTNGLAGIVGRCVIAFRRVVADAAFDDDDLGRV